LIKFKHTTFISIDLELIQMKILSVSTLFEKLQSKYSYHEILYIARSRIIDTYYLPILWYSLPYLELDKNIVKKFGNESCKFIWQPRKVIPVKSETLKLYTSQGGIKLTDISMKKMCLTFMLFRKILCSKPKGCDIFTYFYDRVKGCNTIPSIKRCSVPSM